tara:strand:- start:100 stop:417 length:318 start_codon:yes stop_codon:yes gene_type:complete
MKDTNEIEKQLQHKADKYLEQKAQEMQDILVEVKNFVGARPMFFDYIKDLSKYKETNTPKAEDFCAYTDFKLMKDKFYRELKLNFKKALVAKYTKELITKLDIFE